MFSGFGAMGSRTELRLKLLGMETLVVTRLWL